MKMLNTLLCLMTIIAVGSILARPRGPVVQRPSNQPPALQQPGPQQPGQKATFKQLHDAILKESPAAAGMFTGKKFSDTFIAKQIQNATNSEIGKEGLRALLQTARDQWLQFEGDDTRDMATLTAINTQIDNAVAKMQQ